MPKSSFVSISICYIAIITMQFLNRRPKISWMEVQLTTKQSPKLLDQMRAEIREVIEAKVAKRLPVVLSGVEVRRLLHGM